MKLSYYCSSCKIENYLNTKTTNRYDFLIEFGKNEINKKCKHCGNFTNRHINRLHAEPNKLILLGGVFLAILVTALLWDFGLVCTLTATIPIAIGYNKKKKTSDFNRTMVK